MLPTSTLCLRHYAALLLATGFAALAAEGKHGAYHGALATEYPTWFKDSFLNLRDDIAEAKAQHKRVMLLFTQDNCPYCNALVERNLAQKETEQLLRQRFEVVAINLWGDREVMGFVGDTVRLGQSAIYASCRLSALRSSICSCHALESNHYCALPHWRDSL